MAEHGVVGDLALPHSTLSLSLTGGQFSQVKGPLKLDDGVMKNVGGYVLEDGDFWVRSGRVAFDATRFFVAVEAFDMFGTSVGKTNYDAETYAATMSVDAMGNRVDTRLDYRVLAAKITNDANNTSTYVAYDALGLPGRAGTFSVDAGERIALATADGLLLRARDAKGRLFEHVFDELRRCGGRRMTM